MIKSVNMFCNDNIKEKTAMRKKKKSLMKRILSRLVIEAIVGGIFAMVYVHRRVIVAAIKGEELPKAPKGCPAYKKD